MAELLLAAGAAYLGYKAARRVRSAYSNAKEEVYAEQGWSNPYDQPTAYYSQPYTGGSSGSYYYPSGYHGGESYPSGYSYGSSW